MSRAEFTKSVKREALARADGVCEATGILYGLEKYTRCNMPLSFGVEFDHVVRAADGGDNSLKNCKAVCIKCHAFKTRKFDIPQAAKTKRMSDKDKGIDRPKGNFPPRPKQPKSKPVKLPMQPRRSLYQQS